MIWRLPFLGGGGTASFWRAPFGAASAAVKASLPLGGEWRQDLEFWPRALSAGPAAVESAAHLSADEPPHFEGRLKIAMMHARMGLGAGSAARFAGAGALVLFLCWQHVQATRLGYRVEAARKEAASRHGRVAALRMELEEKLSPEQVSARAAKLGLVPAAPDALRRLPERAPSPAGGALARLWKRGLVPLVAATRS